MNIGCTMFKLPYLPFTNQKESQSYYMQQTKTHQTDTRGADFLFFLGKVEMKGGGRRCLRSKQKVKHCQIERQRKEEMHREDRETGARIGGGAQTDGKSFWTEMRRGQNKE